MEEAKWASATYLMAWMLESSEYLSPNLPLSKELTSSLLLFMILHRIMYLKQFTDLTSCAAIKGSNASQKYEQAVLQSWSWAQSVPDMRSISARMDGWQQTLLALAREAVREALALAQFLMWQLILDSNKYSYTSNSLSSAFRTSIKIGSMILILAEGSPTSKYRAASFNQILFFRQVRFSFIHHCTRYSLSSICRRQVLGTWAMQSTRLFTILASLGLENKLKCQLQLQCVREKYLVAIDFIFQGCLWSAQYWARPQMAFYFAFITASSPLTVSQIRSMSEFYEGFFKQLSTRSTYDMRYFKNYLNSKLNIQIFRNIHLLIINSFYKNQKRRTTNLLFNKILLKSNLSILEIKVTEKELQKTISQYFYTYQSSIQTFSQIL